MSTDITMTDSEFEPSYLDNLNTFSSDSTCDLATTEEVDEFENQFLVGDKICFKCKQPSHYP